MNAKIFPFKSYFWSIHQGSTLVFEVTLENLSRSQDWQWPCGGRVCILVSRFDLSRIITRELLQSQEKYKGFLSSLLQSVSQCCRAE